MAERFDITLLPSFVAAVEIAILATLCYYVMVLFRGRRGAPILTGFVLAVVLSIAITQVLHLNTLAWLFSRFSVYLAVAVMVIFQPEIRQALAELGKQHFFGGARHRENLADQLVQTASFLSERKIGALIAIEQTMDIKTFTATGTIIDAAISPELLCTIFFPYTPLHDGGVIIKNNRIAASGCMFPITERENLPPILGARHRAALGLSEESDAIVLLVSEETGAMGLCHKGGLHMNLSAETLRGMLAELLMQNHGASKEAKPGLAGRLAALLNPLHAGE